MSLVTLLTDFGLDDPFVGQMKGVLASLAPDVRPVDLTHGIAPGNVREGAWVLATSWAQFPAGSCHLAVVDPGVGGARRALAAAAGGHFFVGPDNGLLVPALEAAGGGEIREITVRELEHARRGTTFDGRDVFAPAAARLASGVSLTQFGPEVQDPAGMSPFRPARTAGGWDVEIVRVDRFGNLVTVAEEAFLREELGEAWRSARVRAGREWVEGIRVAYGDVDPGETLLSIGGSGTLEISVNGGRAAEKHGLGPGDGVFLAGPGG